MFFVLERHFFRGSSSVYGRFDGVVSESSSCGGLVLYSFWGSVLPVPVVFIHLRTILTLHHQHCIAIVFFSISPDHAGAEVIS